MIILLLILLISSSADMGGLLCWYTNRPIAALIGDVSPDSNSRGETIGGRRVRESSPFLRLPLNTDQTKRRFNNKYKRGWNVRTPEDQELIWENNDIDKELVKKALKEDEDLKKELIYQLNQYRLLKGAI